MKYTRYRATINKFNPDNLPDSTVVDGIIFEHRTDAKAHTNALIKDLFNKRFTTNICPDMGYDPLKYELDTSGVTPYITYRQNFDEKKPVFCATYTDVTCVFIDTTNYILYRAMKITKYLDKWYVSSRFNDQIIGIIDDKGSLNEICGEADKIWESIKVDHKEPEVILADN